MKPSTLLAIMVIMLMQAGCVFVRPKAPTVLKLQRDTSMSEYVSVGFRDAKWAMVDGSIILVGYGWHYREHETYAFVMSEPSSFNPRWLLIQEDGTAGNATIRVRWPFGGQPLRSGFSPEPTEYHGQIQAFSVAPGRTLTLTFRDVPLRSIDNQEHVFLSGRIKAKPGSEQAVRQMLEFAETRRGGIAEPAAGPNRRPAP